MCQGVCVIKSRGFAVKRLPKCCPKNRRRYCAKRKVESSGGKWRGRGNPCIRTGKSDGLSPPDNSPLDKCGQAAEEPASAVMGCRTAIRTKLAWAKWGSEAAGPQAEKLRQQRRSFQLLLAKPLKKFTRRHSPHSANIGYSACIFVCLNSRRAHVSGTSICGVQTVLQMTKKKEVQRERQREKISSWCLCEAGLLKTYHEICFFTESDGASTMNWSPDGDLALCVVVFSSAHLPAQILDNLHAPSIPNPSIHPHSLHPEVSPRRTGLHFGSL